MTILAGTRRLFGTGSTVFGRTACVNPGCITTNQVRDVGVPHLLQGAAASAEASAGGAVDHEFGVAASCGGWLGEAGSAMNSRWPRGTWTRPGMLPRRHFVLVAHVYEQGTTVPRTGSTMSICGTLPWAAASMTAWSWRKIARLSSTVCVIKNSSRKGGPAARTVEGRIAGPAASRVGRVALAPGPAPEALVSRATVANASPRQSRSATSGPPQGRDARSAVADASVHELRNLAPRFTDGHFQHLPMWREFAGRVGRVGIPGQGERLAAAAAPVDLPAVAAAARLGHPVGAPEPVERARVLPDPGERALGHILELQEVQ